MTDVALMPTMLGPNCKMSRVGPADGELSPYTGCIGGAHRWSDERQGNEDPAPSGIFEFNPNPFSPYLTLKLLQTGEKTQAHAALYDLNGRFLIARSFQETLTLETADLPAGIYFLKVDNGDQRFISKVVKIQ